MEKWQLDQAVADFLGIPSPFIFLDEFNTASPEMLRRMSLLIGAAGTGKSAIIKKTARKLGKKIQKIKIATLEPEDVCGIPQPIGNRLSKVQKKPTRRATRRYFGRAAARGLQRRGGRTAQRPTRSTRSKTWTRT